MLIKILVSTLRAIDFFAWAIAPFLAAALFIASFFYFVSPPCAKGQSTQPSIRVWHTDPNLTESHERAAANNNPRYRCTLKDALRWALPDDTIVLGNGKYPPAMYIITQPGITLKAESRYGAVLHGSPHHNLVVDSGADRVTISGLQVQGAYLDGIKSYANHTTIEYCWIVNNSGQGIANHYFRGLRLYRNIIEGNGANGFAHGIYISGHDAVIQENIVRLNIGHGLHAYHEGDKGCSNFLVLGNLCYRNGSRNILVDIDNSPNTRPSIIANNTCVQGTTGITLFGGRTKEPTLIVNNICVQNTKHSFELFQGENKQKQHCIIDHNLTDKMPPETDDYYAGVPANRFGRNNVIGKDPLFVQESRSFYHLKKSSPARGIGKDYRSLALPGLFPVSPESPTCDAGAIQYHPVFETDEFRAKMPLGPYAELKGEGTHTLPFAWTFPTEEKRTVATVELQASADSYLISSNPDQVVGNLPALVVGEHKDSPGIWRGLIQFDLSSMPANATVSAATLKLTLTQNGTVLSNKDTVLEIRRVNVLWEELETTWNSSTTGEAWDSAGCGSSVDREDETIGSQLLDVDWLVGQQVSISLDPSKVQEWISGTKTNNGMLLKTSEEDADAFAFASREYTSVPGRNPVLEVTYSTEVDSSIFMDVEKELIINP